MQRFPSPEQINQAFEQAISRLGEDFQSNSFLKPPLDYAKTAIFLKFLLLQGLKTSEINYWRKRWKQDKNILLRDRLKEFLPEIRNGLNTAIEYPLSAILSQQLADLFLPKNCLQLERILDLAVEAVLSEALAPEICLRFSPLTEQELSIALPGSWQHAVIFAAPYFFSHEYYPLAIDAYVHDAQLYGESHCNVLAAHIDWLTEQGNLKRILYLDFVENRLVEAELVVPIRPDSVQFLCLGQQEQAIHQMLSNQFHCLQFNPFSVSNLADDKAATLAGWEGLGLDVPNFQEVAVGDFETALEFLERFAEIVVKPNRATEGELVVYFKRDNPESRSALLSHLQQCWQQGLAIVQQRRDGVCYRDPASGTLHTLTLRFNISGNADNQHFVESGYVQLGTDLQQPAACGRDGRIVTFEQILANLCTRTAGLSKSVSLDAESWGSIRLLAERAGSLFPNLCLLGLDVLLDVDGNGKIIPVFLEANPRPAGLCHSRLLTGNLFGQAEIGVSLRLWDCLLSYKNH